MKKSTTSPLVTIGADPEVFFATQDGQIVPSEYVISGEKSAPKPINERGFFILNDNIMAEFNIPPAKTKEEFYDNIQEALSFLAQKALDAGDLEVKITPTALLTPDELSACSKGWEFGCEPDECIYNSSFEEGTILLEQGYRFAGGHVHIGYDKQQFPNIERRLVEVLDLLLSIPFVVLDDDKLRRSIYGKAGRFRIKDYGLEYRSLSNYWLKYKELTEFVFEQAQLAVRIVTENLDNKIVEDLNSIIDNSDVEAAHVVMSKYQITLPKIKIYEQQFAG
jgi:hypothetical protein